MPVMNLALVVESRRVSPLETAEVASALQRQVSRDFGPIWGVDATIDGFSSLDRVPPGYWVVLVRDQLAIPGLIGIHLDDNGQPYALVRRTPTWTLAASHEVLEMLADPFGSRVMPGGSPKRGQGIVELLVEVCDPVGSPNNAYTVNGVLVSDFITPNYYDPSPVTGVRYSFSGALDRPRSIAPGGYLSWRDPISQEWWSWSWVGVREPAFTKIGIIPPGMGLLREAVDSRGELAVLETGLPEGDPRLAVAAERYASSRAVSAANAAGLRRSIARLERGLPRPTPAGGPPGGVDPRPVKPDPVMPGATSKGEDDEPTEEGDDDRNASTEAL